MSTLIVVRVRFRGEIAGVGSTSGIRVVVGRWDESPYGPVADAMVETQAGHRLLLAPSQELADFISATYVFDEVRVGDFDVSRSAQQWIVRGNGLDLTLGVGRRTSLGALISLVPKPVARSPLWCSVTDPVARVLLRGVRTRGTAGGGRREWYGATGVRAVTSISGSFDGQALGELARVDPPCRFGFSSTPARPTITSVTTTIDLGEGTGQQRH